MSFAERCATNAWLKHGIGTSIINNTFNICSIASPVMFHWFSTQSLVYVFELGFRDSIRSTVTPTQIVPHFICSFFSWMLINGHPPIAVLKVGSPGSPLTKMGNYRGLNPMVLLYAFKTKRSLNWSWNIAWNYHILYLPGNHISRYQVFTALWGDVIPNVGHQQVLATLPRFFVPAPPMRRMPALVGVRHQVV